MKIAIIGRTELLYDTALRLKNAGHDIVCILTAKEAPEYTRKASDFRQLEIGVSPLCPEDGDFYVLSLDKSQHWAMISWSRPAASGRLS